MPPPPPTPPVYAQPVPPSKEPYSPEKPSLLKKYKLPVVAITIILVIIIVFLAIPKGVSNPAAPQTPVPTAYQQSTPYYTPMKTVYTTTAPTVTQVSGGPLSTAEYNPSSRAQFRANRTAGPAPLTVSFYDLTLGGPVKWVWDFGDTSGSSERNPVHIYKKAGKYTVTMNTVISGTMYSNSMNITVTGS
ncbi:MAG: PKD domain-containing protein [Methanoregula sp.]|nr:PKD domain-containing protein [Methanoregula sp.]